MAGAARSADAGVSRLITQQGVTESTTQYFLGLPQKGKVQAEYIWIGGSGEDLRSKTKTLNKQVRSLADLPEWNYDGSSTDQATGADSEVWLIPVKYVPDPFRPGPNVLVLCETLAASNMQPLATNRRAGARAVFENPIVAKEKCWYGIEQEYTLFESDGVTPLGWPKDGFPGPQGPYYCSVGARRAVGRQIVEAHYRACLFAGLDISGINAEVMCGQWEYQVGPCVGIDSPDQVWLSRYILERVAEKYGVVVSFSAKPIKGDWNGAGAHTNFSTKSMRTPDPTHVPKTGTDEKLDKTYIDANSPAPAKGSVRTSGRGGRGGRGGKSPPVEEAKLTGFKAVVAGIEKLGRRHEFHMKAYGKGNEDRLLGTHETARFDQFSYGVANRGCSVRIPRMTEKEGYGYLEDRRPAANCDPYDVTSLIADTILLQE